MFVETETPEQMEKFVMDSQWDTFWDQTHFRMKMAERALEWSWTEMDIDGTSRDFLLECERAQFFIVGFHYREEERLATDSKSHALPDGFMRKYKAKPPIKVKITDDKVKEDPWGF